MHEIIGERHGADQRQPWEIDAANYSLDQAVANLKICEIATKQRNTAIDKWMTTGGKDSHGPFEDWYAKQNQY